MNRTSVSGAAQNHSYRLAAPTAMLMIAFLACGSPEETELPVSSDPEPPAAPVAEIFGSGILSTAAPEFATSLTADGAIVYFNRAAPDRSTVTILASERVDGIWSEPETVPFSGVYFDVDPFVTAEGSRIFFSSNRPGAGEGEPGDFDLWVAERDPAGEWTEPRSLGAPINTEAAEIYSTLSNNGNLYFSSDRDGASLIYVSRWVDGSYQKPERLVLGSAAKSGGGNPAIAPDESFIVFSDERESGHGGSDLYVSFQRNGAWTAPRNLGEPINSAFADFAPVVSWDGAQLFWTSERPGIVPAGGVEGRPPGDLYRIEWPRSSRIFVDGVPDHDASTVESSDPHHRCFRDVLRMARWHGGRVAAVSAGGCLLRDRYGLGSNVDGGLFRTGRAGVGGPPASTPARRNAARLAPAERRGRRPPGAGYIR